MVSVETVEHLANRPPTPPKDHNHVVDQAIHLLDADFDQDLEDSPSRAATPVQPSPPSSQDTGTRLRSGKRVEFSPCITAHDPVQFVPSAGVASPIPRRFPSSKQPKPKKSILKATLDLQTPTPDVVSPAPDYFSISDPKTFPAMLESVLRFLDNPSTAMRLDGYSTLNGALKAYEDLPDLDALRSKMPLLAKYIIRDISEPTSKSTPMTSNLTTQALKLTTALLMLPTLEDAMDEQFQTMLVDRAIEVLEQDPVPKSVANHHMFLLATQRFHSRVVTPTKVERIVASLNTVHERVSGNSVVASRLVIYLRLMEQASSTMLGNMRDWMPHIFHGALSSVKDVRSRAIETGTQAAMLYGTIYQSTKVILDLFNTATAEGGTYGSYFTTRLFDMAKPKGKTENVELEEAVPQIWSMVVLFFRSRPVRLSHWKLFCEEWFLLIQNCLNSKDINVKYRATCAWNRLVFVVNPDREMREKMEGWDHTLRVPFMYILHNAKGRDKKNKEVRHIALSGYCNLLHYALRPSQSWEDLDYFWDYYVHQVLSKLLLAGGRDANMACRVLKALFDGKSTVWDEEAVNKAPLLPENLSRLDPKWIRSRSRIILDLLAPFLELSLARPGEGHGIDATPWRELMTAIASAGSHEVLRSQELKECLAHLMNLFSRIWAKAPKHEADPDSVWIQHFTSLVKCSIENIGPLPFGEENLSQSHSKVMEAAPTPSNRASKHHERFQSSAVFLFEMFGRPPPSVNLNGSYFDAAESILHQICQGRNSRKERLDIIRKCAEVNSAAGSVQLWKIALNETALVLRDSNLNETVQEPARLGHQARHAISILATGLHLQVDQGDALTTAFDLLDVLAKILKQEAGEGGVILGLMEPMAEALLNETKGPITKAVVIQVATRLLKEGTFPRNKQHMDEGRKLLWNMQPSHSKQGSFEPFNHVYELIKSTLLSACPSIDEVVLYLADFIEAVQGFLVKCPLSLFASPVLRKIQIGVAEIVKDESCVLTGDKGSQRAFAKVASVWQSILDRLKNVPSNNTLLKALDELFVGGLNSSHQEIINMTVSFWNSTFGRLETLDYPDRVQYAIRRLRPLVELDLPTFPDNFHEPEPTVLQILDGLQQDTSSELPTPRKQPFTKRSQRIGALNRSISASPRQEQSPARRRPIMKTAPKSKLRHDDSQVEFTAVESSSPVAMESQVMTEHQKDVRSRQKHDNPSMYPEFSSSPGPQTRSMRAAISKLDFSKQQQDTTDTGYATPTLNDDHGHVDDYVTSSPTPKAAEKNTALVLERPRMYGADKEDVASDADDTNIPSSPPEVADETIYEGTTELEDMQAEGQDDIGPLVTKPAVIEQRDAAERLPEASGDVHQDHSAKRPMRDAKPKTHPSLDRLKQDVDVKTSSDVYMDAQSEIESTTNVEVQSDLAGSKEVEATDFANERGPEIEGLIASDDSSPLDFTDSLSDLPQGTAQDHADDTTTFQETAFPSRDEDTSRILDSFVESTPAEDDQELDATTDIAVGAEAVIAGPSSQTHDVESSFKRKREDQPEQQVALKRRKSAVSPLKRLMSFFSASQPDEEAEEDEEMQDCIVVRSQPEQGAEVELDAPEEGPVPDSTLASAAPTSTKRGRGRAKKTGPPAVSSPVSSVRTRASKRRASAMEDDESQGSSIVDTSAPRKSRRLTRSQDAKSSQSIEEAMPSDTRQQKQGPGLIGVVIEPSQSDEESADEEQENQEAELQLKHEEEANSRNRSLGVTWGVLERFKSLVNEAASIVLGSREEHEFQKTMLAMSTTVYEARKRSREMGVE